MFTRAERIGQAVTVGIALVFAVAVGGFLLGRGGGPGGAAASPTPSPTAAPPKVTFVHQTCCDQTARYFDTTWSVSEKVSAVALTVTPDPGFACEAALDASGLSGTASCRGLLKGATRYVATLSVTTQRGRFATDHAFTTMADRLNDVKWFTEFEKPGDPLACAAASVRIVQNYTTGKDPMTAEQILAAGKPYGRSKDPGLDPVAIATMQQELDASNTYHYYRLGSREEATRSAVYWLVRSGKPVHVISLAGQHDPVLIGFTGYVGTFYGDPANTVSEVVVLDPQRGDMRPETARYRPDKYRTPGFQTGQPIGLQEWYGDEWWLGYPYQATIRMPNGTTVNIERSDGLYASPHWAGSYVIIVDDGDAAWPPDKEGRVQWR